MQTQLAAIRERIDEIFALRNESHDQSVLDAEYHWLTDREAILLRADDISTGNGLDPASLQRVLAPASHEGDGALVGARPQPPAGPHPVRTAGPR